MESIEPNEAAKSRHQECDPEDFAHPPTRHGRLTLVGGLLVGMGLALAREAGAVTLFSSPFPPAGFADILADPLNHQSWDNVVITYRFEPNFTAMFPNAAIQEQVRQAFREWEQANLIGYGTRDSYKRFAPSAPPNNFIDIRTVTLHEIGHCLGFGHPEMGAAASRNFRKTIAPGAVGGTGPLTVQPNTTSEVMFGTINPGDYNHVLSWDELDAFHLVYGAPIQFVEVTAPAPADILIGTFTDPSHPGLIAQGIPSGALRVPGNVTGGGRITSATLQFNAACGQPIGFRSLNHNWDITCPNIDVHTFTVRARGSDNHEPLFTYNNPGPNAFPAPSHSVANNNFKEDAVLRWTNPTADVPANSLFHLGLGLDVWDWTVVSAVGADTGGLTCSASMVSTHPWFNIVVTGTPAAARAAADHGLTMFRGTNFVRAEGLILTTSDSPVNRLSNLRIGDVTGLNLQLSELNRASMEVLETLQHIEPINSFERRVLPANSEFIIVLRGTAEDVPESVRQEGRFLVLNRPDLVGRELFVFVQSENDETTVGNFTLAGERTVAADPERPRLTIAKGANRDVILSWPNPSDGFSLLGADDLATSGWAPVDATVRINGTLKQVTLPVAGTSRFYRLAPIPLPTVPPAAPKLEFVTAYIPPGLPPEALNVALVEEIPYTPIPGALDSNYELAVQDVVRSDPTFRAMVGERFAFIAAAELEYGKERPRGTNSPLAAQALFFSHSFNKGVQVLLRDLSIVRVRNLPSGPFGPAPPCPAGLAEISQAIALAQHDPRLVDQVPNLQGDAIIVDVTDPQAPGFDHRVLHVSFSAPGEELPRFFAYVDLTDNQVLRAGAN